MQRIFIIYLITLFFSVSASSEILESGPNAYIKVYKTSGVAGLNNTATVSANADPRSSWGAACSLPSGNQLCWNDPPYIPFTIKSNSKYLLFSLYAGDGYGYGNVTLSDNSVVKTVFDMAGYTNVSRYFRIQFPVNVTLDSASCGYSQSVSPTSQERSRGIVSVFMVSSLTRWATCNFKFNSFDVKDDIQGAVSFGGGGLRYSFDIFTQLEAGEHLMTGIPFIDKLTLTQYTDSNQNNITNSNIVFDSFRAYLNLNIIGYISPITLLTPDTLNQTFNPSVDTLKRYQFDMLIDTNAIDVTATVNCQYTISERCALSNGNELLPIEIGFKADFSGGGSTAILKPGQALVLNRRIGYIYTTPTNKSKFSLIFTLYSSDVKALTMTKASSEYRGTMTLMVDANF